MERLLSPAAPHDRVFDALNAFLDHRSLCSLYSTSKAMHDLETRTESAWKRLCDLRWRLKSSNSILRQSGSTRFKAAFRVFSHRAVLPRGAFTESHHPIFGLGTAPDFRAWFLLGHTSDAKPKIMTVDDREALCFVLRICVQSQSIHSIRQPRVDTSINTKDFTGLKVLRVEAVALNGAKLDASADSTIARLSYLDFAVYSILIESPIDVQGELDLLCMLSSLDISIEDGDSKSPLSVHVNVKDEEEIWKNYIMVPSGVTLLKDSSAR